MAAVLGAARLQRSEFAKATMKNIRQLYIGIDPGLSGAVAALMDHRPIGVWDTPTTIVKRGKKTHRVYLPASMVALLKKIPSDYDVIRVVVGLEEVHAMPGQGVTSMFSMGKGSGLWEGIVTALGMPLVRIPPQRWKKEMLADSRGKDKQASIVRTLELFPEAAPQLARKKDEGRAEAILIAEYLRRSKTGVER
jgi:crossover junction endodeoxyribonuclease RuvC